MNDYTIDDVVETVRVDNSDPDIPALIAAGLLAQKAVEKGLQVPKYVKTSFAPGSRVVTKYLEISDLQKYLDALGFNIVGYGCTTCIGNSGKLKEDLQSKLAAQDYPIAAIESGNRNFEGRVNPLTKDTFLASPPLVVAYALAGTVDIDITKDPLGTGKDGQPASQPAHIAAGHPGFDAHPDQSGHQRSSSR